jgi:diguanylate cyclase (GGDEF)-like protein
MSVASYRWPATAQTPAIVKWSSNLTMLVGFAALAGWAFQVEGLQTMVSGGNSMKVATALSLLFLGASLRLVGAPQRSDLRTFAGRALAFAPLVISGLAVCEMLLHWQTSLDEWLFGHGATRGQTPGRMSPATAMSVLALSTAVELITIHTTLARRLSQAFILLALMLTGLALIGYVYGVESLYRTGIFSSVATHTAGTLLLCSIGLLHVRRDFGLMEPLQSQGVGGRFARRALPLMVGIPLLLGWMRLYEGRLGYVTFEFGVAVHTVATIVLFVIIIWWSARSLDRADQRHEQARKEASDLRRLSHLDPLTGIFNRRSLHERLDREWSKAVRHSHPLACLMIDIDHFKRINDTYGHQAGDVVLRTVAAMLVRQCRPGDLVCRYGGEEFCIIAPQTDEQGAAELAERLRSMFEQVPIPFEGRSEIISTSLGVSEAWGWTDDSDAMIRRADRALLAAKVRGRNQVVRSSIMTSDDDRSLASSLAL